MRCIRNSNICISIKQYKLANTQTQTHKLRTHNIALPLNNQILQKIKTCNPITTNSF